jgi:hypothetical protein
VTDRPAQDVFALCSQLLPQVDGTHLDCVSGDLALLLAARGVADVSAPFAQDWRFDLAGDDQAALPRVDLPPSDQDELLGRRTGWRPRWRPITSLQREVPYWRRALGDASPVVLVGDAYYLPWVPYQGHEHMDHGFTLEGISAAGYDRDGVVAHIADPYDNVTEWGHAEPVSTRLPLHSLAPALAGGRWAVLERVRPEMPADPAVQVTANAAAILAAAGKGAYQRFVEAHERSGLAELQSLAVATWLLARNRELHARWLTGLPASVGCGPLADRFSAEISSGWRRATGICYIALRRVRSGRAAPAVIGAVRSVAEAEADLACSLLSRTSGETPDGRRPAFVCQ